jgi:hypothetical protein
MKRIAGALILAGTYTTMAIAQAPAPSPALGPEAKTLHDMANRLGMLRGQQLRDVILTFEYQGTGELFGPGIGAKGMRLTRYKASVAYDAPGMRVDFDRALPDGSASQRQILVVSAKYAWDETEPGAGLVAGKGTASAVPAAWADRALEFWMLPHSFVKAARMPGSNARLGREDGGLTVTTNVPNMPGVTMKAWVNVMNLIDRVESRLNTSGRQVTIEARYDEYRDIGGDQNPSDVLFPTRIVRQVDGTTVLQLTVTEGNTYNPYVIIPVPDAIAAGWKN